MLTESELQSLYGSFTTTLELNSSHVSSDVATEKLPPAASEKVAKVPKAEPPKPLNRKAENESTDMLKWKEKIAFGEIPRENVEVIIHSYNRDTKGAWCILLKDKPACNAIMKALNSVTTILTLPKAEQVQVGDLFAAFYKEKVFCRVEIMGVDDQKYDVRSLDYGDRFSVGLDKLRFVPPELCTQKSFAFPVTFKDSRERFLLQKLMINFTGSHTDEKQVVETVDVLFTGAVEILLAFNLSSFEACVCSMLDTDWYAARVKFPSGKIPRFSRDGLNDTSKFEVPAQLEKGMVIVVEEYEQIKKRGVVIAVDQKSGMCVVFLCDFGIVKEIPIPKHPRLLPYDLNMFPAQTVFIKLDKTPEKDVCNLFCHKSTSFNVDILDPSNIEAASFDVKITVSGNTILGKLFAFVPDLKTYGRQFWSFLSETKMPVKLLKANVESKITLFLHPSEVIGHVKKVLNDQEYPSLTNVPVLNEMVVFTLLNKTTLRGIVTYLHGSTAKVYDLDGGGNYDIPIKELKAPSEVVQNIPVHGMCVSLEDYPEYDTADAGLVREFFELGHLKRRELVLTYDGHPSFGVKLLLNFQSGSIVAKLKEFIETRKRETAEKVAEKLREAEEATKKIEAEKRAAEEREKLALEARIKAEELAAKEAAAKAAAAKESDLKRQKLLMALKALEDEEAATAAAAAPIPEPTPKRVTFEDMALIKFVAGQTYELLILDTMPTKSMMAVCQYNQTNIQFVQEIMVSVESFVNTVDINTKKGFKPK